MRSQTSTRCPRPRRAASATRRLLRLAVAAAASLLIAPAAFAYTTGAVEWLDFPQISVASDGDHYTAVTGIGYGWEGRVDIESSGLPLVKSWSLHPILGVEGLESLSFALYKQGRSYPFGKWPKDVHRTVGSIVPNVFVNDFAVEACNRNLELMMNQGLSRDQVMGTKRVVAATVWGDLQIDITVGTPIIEGFSKDAEIVCEKSPIEPPKPPRPASGSMQSSDEFVLDNAQLTISPSTFSGACPKDLTLSMRVQGSLKGTFDARIESTAGWKSTKWTLKTNEFDRSSGLWTREFSEPFTVPVVMPPPAHGGGGIAPASGDLQVQQLPGDDLGGGPSTPWAAGGDLAPADPGSNVHQQSLRLVAVANGKTVTSSWEQYRVTCDPKRALPPATGAFLPGGTGPEPPKPPRPTPRPLPTPDPSPTPTPVPDSPRPAPATPGARPVKPTGAPNSPAPNAPAPDKPAKPSKSKKSDKAKAQAKKEAASKPAPASSAKPPAPARVAPAAKVSQVAAKAAGLPDLRVSSARPSAKKAGTIEFLVENGGQAAAAASRALVTCSLSGGGGESWSVAVPAMRAKTRRWIASGPQRAQRAKAPDHGCEIRLDVADGVVESDEANNRFVCGECAPAAAGKR